MTASTRIYRQQEGRVCRSFSGEMEIAGADGNVSRVRVGPEKRWARILSHSGNWRRHGLLRHHTGFSLDDDRRELEHRGCSVQSADDTGRFPGYADLYLEMLGKQLTYDALKLIGWDADLMQTLAGELSFIRDLAHAGKIAQGRVIARTP